MADDETRSVRAELQENVRLTQNALRELRISFIDTRSALSAMQSSVRQLQTPPLSLAASLTQLIIEYTQERQLQQQKIEVTKSQIAEIQDVIASIQEQKNSTEESVNTNNSLLQRLTQQKDSLESNVIVTNALADTERQKVGVIEQQINDLTQQDATFQEGANQARQYAELLRQRNIQIQSELDTISIPSETEIGSTVQAEQSLVDSIQRRAQLLEEQSNNEEIRKESLAESDRLQELAHAIYNERLDAEQELARLSGETKEKLDAYQTELKSLTEKLTENKKEIDDATKTQSMLNKQLAAKITEETTYTENLQTLQGTLKKQEDEFKKNTELTRTVARAMNMVAAALIDMERAVRQAQQQFGIAAGAAARLKIDDFFQTIQSNIGALVTLGGQAAVSSQERVAARTSFQAEFGGVISTDAAENVARQAKEMGVTTQQLAQARRIFMTQTMGDLGQAASAQDRLVATFERRGLTSRDAMEAISRYSELLARNGTRFADSFNRAAAAAKQIGVDLSRVDQIGDNIIGNFEGFLEKQAELGAMGFNLDGSRLAEIAESGDTGALFTELRSQLAASGKDITQLRRSEQLALSGAFGIPISELQRMAGADVGSGEKMEDLQKAGNSLLERLVNVMSPLAGLLSAIATAITGVIALTLGAIKLDTTIIAGKGLLGAPSNPLPPAPGPVRGAAGLAGRAAGVAIGVGGGTAIGTAMGGTTTGSLIGSGIGSVAGGLIGQALIPIPGVGFMIGSALGGLTGGAIGGMVTKGDDVVSKSGYGERTLVTPTQTIALNNDDNIIAYAPSAMSSVTDAVKTTMATTDGVEVLSYGELSRVASTSLDLPSVTSVLPTPPTATTTPTPSAAPPITTTIDTSQLEVKLDNVVRAIASIKVQMDGKEVGKMLVNATDAAEQLGTFRNQSRATV